MTKTKKELFSLTFALVLIFSGIMGAFTDNVYALPDINSITWEWFGTTDLGGIHYHIRKITKVNGIDISTTDDISASYAYCVEPQVIGPEGSHFSTGDEYTSIDGKGSIEIYALDKDAAKELTEDQNTNFKTMRKLVYYMPGGGGWTKKTKALWDAYDGSDTSSNRFKSSYSFAATVLSRKWGKAAEDPEGSANYGYNRSSAKAQALVDNVLSSYADWPDPPDNYTAFYIKKDNAQDIWGSIYIKEDGKLKLKKVSANTAITG